MSGSLDRRGLMSAYTTPHCLSTLAFVGLGSLSVYFLTLAPSLTWAHWGADGGDFIAAAAAGRMPHPPGFPLYLALARAAVLIPVGDPAWRTNVLSALMASGAVTLTAMTLHLRQRSPWVAISAALTMGFAPLFWSQALITEAYTTAAFFVALALFFEARGSSRGTPEVFAVGLTWGLATSVHATLVLLAPLWLAYSATWKTEQRVFSPLARLLLGFGVGLLPYALLPLLGPWPQPWGDMRTAAGWWEVVTARIYSGYVFGLPLADVPQRLLAWSVLLVRQFTPLGALAVLLGMSVRWRENRRRIVGLIVACGLVIAFAFGYSTSDSHIYFVPLLPVVVLLLAEGLTFLVGKGLPGWIGVALPLMLLVGNWQALDLHRDHAAVGWLARALAATPQDAVLVTMQDDGHLFALWYAQEALGARRDVLVIDRDLWWQPSYQQFLFKQAERVVAAPEDFAVGRPLCRIVGEEVACP